MLFRPLAILSLSVATVASANEDAAARALRGLAGGINDDCTFKGNGFPKGSGIKAAFKLKLLGRDLDRKEEWNFNPNGDNSIAIALNSRSKILLENSQEEGTECNAQCEDDFCVADPNGTDGDGAKLCLKDPFPLYDNPCIDGTEPSCDEEAVYRIFARVRGQGKIDITSCVEDTDTTGEKSFSFCDTGNTVTLSDKKALDISQSLLTICYDGAGIGLFDEICLEEDGSIKECGDGGDIEEQYFWQLDNNGARNTELRFYSQDDLDALFEGTSCEWGSVTRGLAC